MRVGVFADAALQPRWIVEALARAAASQCAEIVLVATREQAPSAKPALLWRAYCRADRALFGSRCDWSSARDVNLIVPRARRVLQDEAGAWHARAREARLDVAFVLGESNDDEAAAHARFGAWRFFFGEAQGTAEPLAALREVVDAAPVTASGVRIRLGRGQPDRIAYQSWARTFPFSLAKSRDALFAKTAQFLVRALCDLHAGGAQWLAGSTQPARPRAEERLPTTAQALRHISVLGTRLAKRAAEKALTVEEWSIAYRFSDDEDWSGSLEGFHRLQPPKGWFWADPFPIQVNGRNYIFFEELPLGASKAHISVVEVDRDGHASKPVKVLERDYHLSYPFLVEDEGRLYMIPETANNRTIEIYRCVDFPTRWKLERVLLKDVFCADTTLHRDGDRWWMFTNAAHQGADVNDELCIYSSDRLLGEWEPHRRNPVKSDVRSARPAGRLFWQNDRLYRPGQIGAPHYGAGIALHRVTRLTRDEYVEQEDRRIMPAGKAAQGAAPADVVLGIHTINRAGDLSVTDAFVRRPRF
ncbi:MAG TPA: hypothetical protein VFP44_03675 [Usitatibacter sp.]|nr:hypothetical protein [Usitatibacter sp.]